MDRSVTLVDSQTVGNNISLSISERQQLIACIKVINEGMNTFIAVGNALMAIRENKLYRETHISFELFCNETFDLTSRRAYQLINAVKAVNQLSSTGVEPTIQLPQTESHAKALADVEPERIREVWGTVVAESQRTGEKITAEKIAKVKEHITGKTTIAKSKPVPKANSSSGQSKTQLSETEDKSRKHNDNSGFTEDNHQEADLTDTSRLLPLTDLRLMEEGDEETIQIRLVRHAMLHLFNKEVTVVISGKFLIRTGLTQTWIKLRGLPAKFEITDDFYDYLSLREARSLGVI